ncbi:MAG: TRCF domain-containing protein [Butyricicoccus sp.]
MPADYVPDPGQRVDLPPPYCLIRSDEGRSDLLNELIDRYGEPPRSRRSAEYRLRAQAGDRGDRGGNRTLADCISPSQTGTADCLSCAVTRISRRLLLNAGSQPYLSLRLKPRRPCRWRRLW